MDGWISLIILTTAIIYNFPSPPSFAQRPEQVIILSVRVDYADRTPIVAALFDLRRPRHARM